MLARIPGKAGRLGELLLPQADAIDALERHSRKSLDKSHRIVYLAVRKENPCPE
jgi:hypothetical protein